MKQDNIICLTRNTGESATSAEWLARVTEAASATTGVLKYEGHQKSVRVRLAPFGEVCLRELNNSAKRRLLSPFRRSKGAKLWHYQSDLRRKGVDFTKPVLYLAVCKGVFITRTYLATEWIDGESLGKLALSGDENALLPTAKAGVTLVARLHGAGYLHGDLKWSNVLKSEKNPETVFFTDLDHLIPCRIAFLYGKDFARYVLSALEYGFSRSFARQLVQWYLDEIPSNRKSVELGLRWTLLKKRSRYENRLVGEAAGNIDPGPHITART